MKRFRLLVLVVGLLALPLIAALFGWLDALWKALTDSSVAETAAYLRSFGIWTPLISLVLMVLQAVLAPLPGSLVAAANGVVFGLGWGVLLSWIGGVAGASASFWIARLFGQDLASRLAGKRLQGRHNPFDGDYGVWLVLMIRLLPVVSIDVLSYAVGLSRMRFSHFILATAIGMIPGTVAWTMVGHDFAYAQSSIWRASLLGIAAVVAYLGMRWWIGRQRRQLKVSAAVLPLADDEAP